MQSQGMWEDSDISGEIVEFVNRFGSGLVNESETKEESDTCTCHERKKCGTPHSLLTMPAATAKKATKSPAGKSTVPALKSRVRSCVPPCQSHRPPIVPLRAISGGGVSCGGVIAWLYISDLARTPTSSNRPLNFHPSTQPLSATVGRVGGSRCARVCDDGTVALYSFRVPAPVVPTPSRIPTQR